MVLVSHFGLASGMKKASEFIVGEQPELYAVELDEEGIEAFKKKLSFLHDHAFDGQTIIVSDIPSGSPGAAAYSLLNEINNVHLISGMNLPLILELVLSGGIKPIAELISDAVHSARETIQDYTIVPEKGEGEDEF
ncbi:hypothetical protein LI951_12380 [Enterococcus sp. BWT-B8]|uniref:PTS sugar transporter subunit IIA n=1 Tax=Enterococcus sp. BWT-B8 TaxID=2885157 RepID=UPI002A141285|nr:hypothetical protein [Enterococcus sp. BWT-B8]MCB5952866.1 hypothetical protein [Enterococcus sp. BWT-B8]